MSPDRPQDICILNCFFNPAGFRTPLVNFNLATEKLLQLGAPLITVEAAFENEPFQLSEQPGQTLIQLRAPARLWLKERLLNIALAHIPSHCTKVAWVDGDLLFERSDWLASASHMLETHEAVQLFENIHYLPPGVQSYEGLSLREHRSVLALVTQDGGDALRRMQRGLTPYAVPGGGFAARREILAGGLYDRSIIGGNDNIFVFALLGALDLVSVATAGLTRDVRLWELAFAAARSSFTHSYVEGSVYHLWHGEREHRGYVTRHDVLRAYEFDPASDITLHDNGCYRWNSPKLGLHEATRQYFRSRLEDGASLTSPSEIVAPSTLPLEARSLISELYRRLGDQGEVVGRLCAEKHALEKELATVRHHAQDTALWAKDLKQGNSWLQSQLSNWKAHAHTLAEQNTNTTSAAVRSPVLLIASDGDSSTSVLRAVAPHKAITLEICGASSTQTHGALQFKGVLNDATAFAEADFVFIILNYMNLSASDLDRAIEQLSALALPTIWNLVANPLQWYCRRIRLAHAPAATPLVDPVQFVSTVEEQRRRARQLHESLAHCRGISIVNDGNTLTFEALTALQQLLNLPQTPASNPVTASSPVVLPENIEAIVLYLDQIGACALREEISSRIETFEHPLAPR